MLQFSGGYPLPAAKALQDDRFRDLGSVMTPTPSNAGGVARCPRQPPPKYYKTAGNPTAAVSQSAMVLKGDITFWNIAPFP